MKKLAEDVLKKDARWDYGIGPAKTRSTDKAFFVIYTSASLRG